MLAPSLDYRILCVDDQEAVRFVLVEHLVEWGYRIVEASSGREAIAVLDSDEKIDLLITDIRLGDIDGWEVAAHARAGRPDLPVIYVSGYPTEGQRVDRAVFLSKPYRSDHLHATVRAMLAQTVREGYAGA